jgi:molybdopterin synthase catalytic subunit
VGSSHRGDAFSACREIVDQIKEQLPVWKHQYFADGTDEWVNCA